LTHFVTISTNGVDGTNAVAEALARQLRRGDVVLLNGGLATGKTTFVKAAARALGSPNSVTSPTFTLAQFYKSSSGNILHIDTYRLASIHEFRDLGLDYDIENAITFIEWGNQVASDFPRAITVEFTHDPIAPDLRVLTVSTDYEPLEHVLNALAGDARPA
jgi:tRNA threonylcarbamoyladenosine biosynthesis protein TsaE